MSPALITDPRNLPPDFYFISKSGVDLLSGLIQWKTGLWNHSMLMRTPGKVVSQGWQITETPIDGYMKKNIRMDFFTIQDINPSADAAMNNYINKRMAGRWYTQTYDFLGILGQAIGQPWIHMPGADYCSEFELLVLRAGAPFLSKRTSDLIMAQNQQSNPQNLHDMYVQSGVFTYHGMYESDEGIIA